MITRKGRCKGFGCKLVEIDNVSGLQELQIHKNMRKFFQIVIVALMVFFLIPGGLRFWGVNGIASAGEMFLLVVIEVILGGILLGTIFSSPAYRKRCEAQISSIHSYDNEQLSSWVTGILLNRLSLSEGELDHSFFDCGVSRVTVDNFLDLLSIDYNLPISSDDSNEVHSGADIVNLLCSRWQSN